MSDNLTLQLINRLEKRIDELERRERMVVPAYNDLFFPVSGARVPAANAPTWSTFTTNTKEYTFAIDDYIDLGAGEVLHDWKEGTDLEVHLHIATNGSDTGDTAVKYNIHYTLADMGEVFAAEATISTQYTIPGGTADKTHLYIDIDTISVPTYKIGTNIKIRVERVDVTAASDPGGDPFVLMVGIHYQVDSLGSRLEGSK